MTIRIAESDLPKLRDFLLERFETAGDLNVFLQKFMWPAYRMSASAGRNISPAYRNLDGSEISLSAIMRAKNGTVLLQLYNGVWWEVQKMRGGVWRQVRRHDGTPLTAP